MKTINRYICEICNTEYDSKDTATKCEENHCKPIDIYNCRYVNMSNNMNGYPVAISVKMADGTIQTYKR